MLTAKQRSVVAGSFLLEGVEPPEDFLRQLQPIRFQPGEEIYSAQRFRSAIAILLSGSAQVRGHSGVLMNLLGPGDCFGVAALFHPVEEYVTTVSARTAVSLVFITDKELMDLFRRCPQCAVNYISFLSRRICFLNRRIESFTAPSALAGLGLWLLEQEHEGEVKVLQGYTRLAQLLNIGRASLYRSLDLLVERGAITRQERTICILDREKLKKECSITP
ncbi:Crp/Fnr family transcriptional regulator [Angelakisella massiliensis]|uniref:Crp/Fnr family transcriptional regulator n=1 Tax=Angelakisella massiliensis TaxID=1871018 RepID=UPI0008F974E3|nr:Crp/Fnr family transcriptional regulator [Angelakisella massiliensis]